MLKTATRKTISSLQALILIAGLGLASVARADGTYSETVAEFLLRYRVFRIQPDGRSLVQKVPNEAFSSNDSMQAVRHRIEDLIEFDHHNPEFAVSLNAENLLVDYEDDRKLVVKKVAVLDHRPLKTKEADEPQNFDQFMEQAKAAIENELASGAKPRIQKFEDTQQNESWRKVTTLTGVQVRVRGLTPSLHDDLAAALRSAMKQHGALLEDYFYYGSSVMPRSEVIKQDPSLDGVLPTSEKGVDKSVVRVGGLTNLSDIDLLIFASADQDLSASIDAINAEIRGRLDGLTREFPINFKVFFVPAGASPETCFEPAKAYYAGHGKTLSPIGIASVKQQRWNSDHIVGAPLCRSLFH